MNNLDRADRLMDELGYCWGTVRGKAQLSKELVPYYHLIDPTDNRMVARFTRLEELIDYLRAIKQERHANGRIAGAGRKPLPPEQRKVRVQWFVSPATVSALEARALPGEGLGVTLDRLIGANKIDLPE